MKAFFSFLFASVLFIAGLFASFVPKLGGSDRPAPTNNATLQFEHMHGLGFALRFLAAIGIFSIMLGSVAAQYGALAAVTLFFALNALCTPRISHCFGVTNTGTYNSPEWPGYEKDYPVAASTKLYAGNIAALNASGYLVAAGDTASIRVIGRLQADVDNSAGSNGDLRVKVKRGIFRFDNSQSNPVTVAYVGKKVFVEDDHTVSISGGTNKIVAGRVVEVDSVGVWVDTRLANAGAIPTATQSAVATTGSTTSSPAGYTTTGQADAIVTALNAARTDIAAILTYLGL